MNRYMGVNWSTTTSHFCFENKARLSLFAHLMHLILCSPRLAHWKVRGEKEAMKIRAATILRLLGNETIQLNTRYKKSEPGLRKQLNINGKSTTKFNFFL